MLDCKDWDTFTVLRQCFLFSTALRTALTGSTIAWTSGILIILFYFVSFIFLFSFHIDVLMKKKRKTLSVSGTVTFLFFQVRLFFGGGPGLYFYDVILQF